MTEYMKLLTREDEIRAEERRTIYERLVASGETVATGGICDYGLGRNNCGGTGVKFFDPFSILFTREDEIARDAFVTGFKEFFQEILAKCDTPLLSPEETDEIAKTKCTRSLRERRKKRIEYVITESEFQEKCEEARDEFLERLQKEGILTPEQVSPVKSWVFRKFQLKTKL